MSRGSNSTELCQNYSLDIEKEDLPDVFIDRLEHVDERGMVGNIQLWTGARRNTATSFVYKGLTVIYFVNGQKFLNTQISIASIRIFLH